MSTAEQHHRRRAVIVIVMFSCVLHVSQYIGFTKQSKRNINSPSPCAEHLPTDTGLRIEPSLWLVLIQTRIHFRPAWQTGGLLFACWSRPTSAYFSQSQPPWIPPEYRSVLPRLDDHLPWDSWAPVFKKCCVSITSFTTKAICPRFWLAPSRYWLELIGVSSTKAWEHKESPRIILEWFTEVTRLLYSSGMSSNSASSRTSLCLAAYE